MDGIYYNQDDFKDKDGKFDEFQELEFMMKVWLELDKFLLNMDQKPLYQIYKSLQKHGIQHLLNGDLYANFMWELRSALN